MKESKLLPCYSVPLRDYLTSQGIRYELVGLHPTSKAMFWVYIKNETLALSIERVEDNTLEVFDLNGHDTGIKVIRK